MNKEDFVKFLIVGDLHGEMPIIHSQNFDAIICPGDICGDDSRPYIKKAMEYAQQYPDEEVSFEDFYPNNFEEIEQTSIDKGIKVLEKLNSCGKPVFLVPGNWDFSPHLDGLDKKEDKDKFLPFIEDFENIQNVEHKAIEFRDITIIGHGSTSAPEPIREEDKQRAEIIGDEEILQRYDFFTQNLSHIKNLFNSSQSPIIFITHNVPLNTKLDKIYAPGLDVHKKHYGSRLARWVIDEHQPLLCIGGHIHEGFGKDKIKNTQCINAGFGGDVNTLVTINMRKGVIENIEFLGKNKKNSS